MFALTGALVICPPFALGAVHPWPAAIVEIGSFLLVIAWALRIANPPAGAGESRPRRLLPLAIPTLLLGSFFAFQLVPLPPGAIRALSPSTYHVYEKTLQGWPRKAPYSDKAFALDKRPEAAGRPVGAILPSIVEVREGAAVPFTRAARTNQIGAARANVRPRGGKDVLSVGARFSHLGIPPTWYPLSLAPPLTAAALLRFSAYASLFFVVLGYSFADGREGERRFLNVVFVAVLITGLLVASIGLVERVYWNGKILWFFVPQDWGTPKLGTLPRATGPFVNPDHFANYLAMVFPLALAGALYDIPLDRRIPAGAARLASGLVALIVLLAIVLSLSRAAWMETAATATILITLWARNEMARAIKAAPRQSSRSLRRPREFDSGREKEPLHGSFAAARNAILIGGPPLAIVLTALLVLFVVGPRGRTQADARVGQAVAENGGIGIRPAVWKATLRMARNFPAFGVGLAAWPEIFPRYESGPWNPYYFREAHNDYLQYLSETGLVGVVLAAWFLAMAVARLFASRKGLSSEDWPLFIALMLALGAMAFHELVDFCLHVPANALLFTLFLGLALRIGWRGAARKSAVIIERPSDSRAAAIGMIGASAALIALALVQKGLAYPYDIEAAATPKEARDVVLAHPVSAKAHVALLDLAGPDMTRGMRLTEIATAVWLDPTDPSGRDLYAKMLVRAGWRDEALGQVTESVFNSPSLGAHFYLNRQLIPWLLPSEQKAVERGFKEAVAARYPGAVDGLGSFYDALGALSEESRLYAEAAAGAREGGARARYLTAAARTEIRESDTEAAEALFRQAIQAAPENADAYTELMTGVYGPWRNLSAAMSIAKDGLRNGADPVRLYMALSSAAQMAGNRPIAEKSLLEAFRRDPSFQTVMLVGQYYLQNGQFDRAASMLQNAVEIKPSSAEAFYLLGVAQERGYQYSDADKAYAQAAILAPRQFRPAYAAFRRRMDASQTKG